MPNLTPKQEKFCQLYIELGNASDAYRGSYNCSRMKAETIHVKASQLLSTDKIRIRIKELQSHHFKRHEATVDAVVQEYSKLAFSNITDFLSFDADGIYLKPSDDLPPEILAAIS